MFSNGFNFSYFDDRRHKFANIELDALLSQNVKMSNLVSEHPLETGEILNDAIHNQPLEISFSAVISDMPQKTLDALTDATVTADYLLGSFGGMKSISGSKSMKAWRELYILWKARQLVTISSPLQHETFDDMAIIDISIDLEAVEGITFTVYLKKVIISENIIKNNLSQEVGKQSVRP